MKIVINAGHTKIGKGTGANKLLNESIETRRIAYHLMELLSTTKHEVIPAVFDRSNDNLKEAVTLSNRVEADLFISIHLNAGGGNGVEVYTWKGEQLPLAKRICENLHTMGYKNRGVKNGSKFYVIKNTKCKSILVECGFVDNVVDYKLYDCKKIAYLLYQAIMTECDK